MTIKIVTDSTCDLPAACVEQYDIKVVPLYINVGNESYRDGIDLTRTEFYQRLSTFSKHPTTATPGIETFRTVYDQLASEGATEIISLHISINLSGTVDVARVAAQQTTSVPVTVLDSRSLSMGHGFLVLRAAELAAEGTALPDILAALEDQILRTRVVAALDTVEFLKRSGRMNKYVAGFAEWLQLKPLLTMYNGKPGADKVRTRMRALRRIMEWLEEGMPLERLAVVHGSVPERARTLYENITELQLGSKVLFSEVNPVIGAHIGPGTLGFAFVSKHKLGL